MKETSCHIFKMAIFSKFFGDLMTHITREYAGKKMKSFLNVSSLKIMDILLSVFLVSSLQKNSPINIGLTSQMTQTVRFMFPNVAYRSTVYKTGVPASRPLGWICLPLFSPLKQSSSPLAQKCTFYFRCIVQCTSSQTNNKRGAASWWRRRRRRQHGTR